MDHFNAAPPVTRTLVAGAFVTSLLVHGSLLDFRRVVFYLPWLFKFPPELWRLVSPFLVTSSGFNFLLDLYFLYTYASALETSGGRFASPADFLTYLLFVCSVILTTAGGLLGGHIFTSALILALAYTYAQEKRGSKVTFYVIQLPVVFLPWAMLALTLVMGGYPAAMHQGTGLVAAHLYEFLTKIYPSYGGGRNWVQTPAFIRRWFRTDQRSTTTRAYGTSFRPAVQQQQQPTQAGGGSSWTSGFSNAWAGRGQGRRLGGE